MDRLTTGEHKKHTPERLADDHAVVQRGIHAHSGLLHQISVTAYVIAVAVSVEYGHRTQTLSLQDAQDVPRRAVADAGVNEYYLIVVATYHSDVNRTGKVVHAVRDVL